MHICSPLFLSNYDSVQCGHQKSNLYCTVQGHLLDFGATAAQFVLMICILFCY